MARKPNGYWKDWNNESPEEVITELKEKVESATGPKKRLYSDLLNHYTKVLDLREELI